VIPSGTGTLELEDTIVAIASAPGRSALALVRLSGPGAFAIAAKHVRPWPHEWRATPLCDVLDGDQNLDRLLTEQLPFDYVIRLRGNIKVTAAPA